MTARYWEVYCHGHWFLGQEQVIIDGGGVNCVHVLFAFVWAFIDCVKSSQWKAHSRTQGCSAFIDFMDYKQSFSATVMDRIILTH